MWFRKRCCFNNRWKIFWWYSGFVVGHICPEAQDGGNIALIEDGDNITIDAVNNTIDVNISENDLINRRSNWIKPDLKFNSGILYKYCKNVSNASNGCVTILNE